MAYALRVSVLDNCQLRCAYCLPPPPRSPFAITKESWLTPSQYALIARALLPLGIEKIRFTGGEPLLRKELPAIIAAFAQSGLTKHLALTTNGLRFFAQREALLDSGLRSITFHFDTLDEARYPHIMGNGSLADVHKALFAARSAGFLVKVNVVVQKGVNDDELWNFLLWSKLHDVEVRFIELMNTGSAKDYVKKTFISGEQILARIAQQSEIRVVGRNPPSAPAEQFYVEELGISFGLIASDTRPFCQACNRLRLSADGRMRTCLYEPLGSRLTSNDTDHLLKEIQAIVARKTSFHPSLRRLRQDFSMAQIGG